MICIYPFTAGPWVQPPCGNSVVGKGGAGISPLEGFGVQNYLCEDVGYEEQTTPTTNTFRNTHGIPGEKTKPN